MKKYRRNLTVIDAIQWNGQTYGEAKSLFAKAGLPGRSMMNEDRSLIIPALEGPLRVEKGDYIIKEPTGQFTSCKPAFFLEAYEKVKE